LEEVTPSVFVLNVPIALIVDKHAVKLALVSEEDSAPSNSLIILPFSIVKITICVVMDTCSVTLSILEITFVELAILHEYFDLAINHTIPIKASFNNLIWECE